MLDNSLEIQASPMDVFIGQAIEKGLDIQSLEKLLQMREKLEAEMAKKEFDKAMSLFQSKCPIIKKSKKVSFEAKTSGRVIQYNYAPLDDILQEAKQFFEECGLSFRIKTKVENSLMTVICTVTHLRGHSESSEFSIPIENSAIMNEAQKFASAHTFCKRYAICNAFGILTGDDDDDSNSNLAETINYDSLSKSLISLIKNKDISKEKLDNWKNEYDQYLNKLPDNKKKVLIDLFSSTYEKIRGKNESSTISPITGNNGAVTENSEKTS